MSNLLTGAVWVFAAAVGIGCVLGAALRRVSRNDPTLDWPSAVFHVSRDIIKFIRDP